MQVVRKRPKIISILAVIGFIFSSGQIITISAPSIRDVAGWYPILYGSIIAMRFISLVGVWHMKKWGVELFAYVTIVKIIVQVLLGDFTTATGFDTFVSVAFAIIFATQYRKMGRDL
ncbi:hypothetical protein BH09BAC5_BH09BAC5_18030 [soil metagenome]